MIGESICKAKSEALNENIMEVEGLEESLDRAGIQKYLTYIQNTDSPHFVRFLFLMKIRTK